jgi:hypothetical protein
LEQRGFKILGTLPFPSYGHKEEFKKVLNNLKAIPDSPAPGGIVRTLYNRLVGAVMNFLGINILIGFYQVI